MRRNMRIWRTGNDSDDDIENIIDRDYFDDYAYEDNDDDDYSEIVEIKRSNNINFKINEELKYYSIYKFIENFNINKSDIENDIHDNNFDKFLIENTEELIEINIQIFNDQKKSFENKYIYLIKKKIFNLILDSGGGIFGGSIRDTLIHDFGSKKFYGFLKNFNNSDFSNNSSLIYLNKYIHPSSFIDRNIIFNDIDSVMTDNQFNKLIGLLDYYNFKYKYAKLKDYTRYIDIVHLENKISSYIILSIKIDNSPCEIKIDILISTEEKNVKEVLDKISANSDFYCNSLYILNDKLHINKDIANNIKKFTYEKYYDNEIKENINLFFKQKTYMKEVIDIVKKQIFHKKAISINLSKKKERRVNKMKGKGFEIIYDQQIYEYIYSNNEICLLCRSDLEPNIKIIKFKCCNSYFHKNCLIETIHNIKLKNCFYCRKIIDRKILRLSLNQNII